MFSMKKIITSLVFLLLTFFSLTAQTVFNTINLYGTNFPQEKIHIHFDKQTYLPGETIWFKAYLFEENLPSTRSTNFYSSLYDENGKLIQQQLLPIFSSTASGHFTIPDSLPGRQLVCRAYTSWMQNFDSSFLFTKAIKLINNDAKDADSTAVKTTSLYFFPEGGDLIAGTKNTIAFKANYNNGLPFELIGVIKKQETGEELMQIKTIHDGMGRFDIDIAAGEKYYAEWTDDKGKLQQTYLPVAKATGVSLKLAQQTGKLIYNIVNKLPGDSLHVLMYMYQKVFYKINLSVLPGEPYTNSIIVSSLPSGTMQLTVFDANWQPVAERVAFINNNNYSVAATITNKETNLQKRGKNVLEIAIPDTIAANMSVSITDADLNSDETNSTIVTDFLLSGDLKGYIHNPAYYFSSDKDAASNLDLLMLTHGWRRYNWNDVMAGRMPTIKYPADDYLMVYGQMNKELLSKMDTDELLNLIIKTKDSTQNFYQLKPDADGYIKKEGLVFYDTARVFYSFKKNKLWNPQVAFSASNYTYQQPGNMYNSKSFLKPGTEGTAFNQQVSLFTYYNKNNKNQAVDKEKTLQGVVVKSGGWNNWKNNPLLKMDERYATGSFSGGVISQAFDVVHDEHAWGSIDIYNYISNKIGGVRLSYSGGKHFMAGDEKPILLFIDENEADDYQLSQINMENVAYIKYIDLYGAKPGIPHALAIYLKKGDDLIDRRPKDTDQKLVKVAGYSAQKEFYQPDYSQSNTTLGTDARTTLLWLPYVLADKNNLKLPVTFYNNDFSKKLRVVLEGINEDGKMIHIEKIIE